MREMQIQGQATATVILVDDHAIMRAGIRGMLEQQPDFEVVGEAADGATAVDLVRRTAPDVVVMDIGMLGMNGIEATRRITTEDPNVKVVVLSMHTDRRYVAMMLRAGASAYLPKDCAGDELVNTIRTVLEYRS